MIDPTLLYRDEHLLAVDKPSGMIVHRGWANDREVLMGWARDLVGAHVHPVHRLDRGTSGVVLFALDPETARRLQLQFSEGQVAKRYLALVRGPMKRPHEVDHPVPRTEDGERVPAQTSFRPLFSAGRYSWVEALPRTGRLHQIRRHLKHLSHPIIGDVRYGKGEHNRYFKETFGLARMALHAAVLGFVHPHDSSPFRVCAPVPAELAEPMGRWGLPDEHLVVDLAFTRGHVDAAEI